MTDAKLNGEEKLDDENFDGEKELDGEEMGDGGEASRRRSSETPQREARRRGAVTKVRVMKSQLAYMPILAWRFKQAIIVR